MKDGIPIEIKGRYYQKVLLDGKAKILEIHTRSYRKKNLDFLIENEVLEFSELGRFIEKLGVRREDFVTIDKTCIPY